MALDKKIIRKKYKSIEEFLENEAQKHRCGCGCNEIIELKESHFWNGVPKFIFGHAARLRRGGPEYERSKYYSVEDIAEMGDVSEQTVRLWARKGNIKPTKAIGRKNLFSKEEIDNFIKSRPKREAFNPREFITVPDLKKMGISRSKLRALVRAGKISEPRLYARKTHYRLKELEKFWNQIQEEKKQKRRRRVSIAAFRELQAKVKEMVNRIAELERIITKIAP
ncbi:helix-turn-helix domain-containing protein [bacterium]|nr:helix-turn-helix domain-containing protein [candidate division CSSED10-310 bacterium]